MFKVFIYTLLIVLDIVVLLLFKAILYVDKIEELEVENWGSDYEKKQ